MSTTTLVDSVVTPLELATTLHAFAGTPDPIPWDDLDPATRRRLETQARRALDRLGDRRLTDPHRHALAKLRSAAREISDDAHTAVEDALAELHGDEHTDAGARAVLGLIQRLDDAGLVDLVAGTAPLDDALRRAQREARA